MSALRCSICYYLAPQPRAAVVMVGGMSLCDEHAGYRYAQVAPFVDQARRDDHRAAELWRADPGAAAAAAVSSCECSNGEWGQSSCACSNGDAGESSWLRSNGEWETQPIPTVPRRNGKSRLSDEEMIQGLIGPAAGPSRSASSNGEPWWRRYLRQSRSASSNAEPQ